MSESGPIRGVLFDVGGVLLRTEDLSPRQKWERRLGLPEWGLAEAVFNSPPSRKASLGAGGPAEIWKHVGEQFSLSDSELDELRRDFWAGDRLDEALLTYIASLRSRYRTAIISNAWMDMREFLDHSALISAAFERIFISAELGFAKPDRRIYDLALGELELKPHEAVFVDDFPENVEAARSVGMTGILYRPGLDVPAELAALNVR